MSRHIYMVMLAALLCCVQAFAQMSFSFYGGATATFSALSDGAQMVVLPAGTDLQGCITGVEVDGVAVNAADVVPNPTTTPITEGEIETFVYQDKAYSFRFYSGAYFTVVMFTDVHIDESREGFTSAEFSTFVDDVVKMGKVGGKKFSFTKAPKGYVPTCDLAMCLGDMDKDSQSSSSNGYVTATAKFNANGIPFVDMVGNHDMVPDYWTGESGSEALTGGTGGGKCNDVALSIVTGHIDNAKNHGVIDVTRFTDGTDHIQAEPYAFIFNGVRFYVGQTYWFQKPYTMKSVLGAYTGRDKYYKPDGVISALDSYVEEHKGEPSIWTQHYPFVAGGSECDRWWLDQNDVGKTILPTDNGSSAYPGTTTKFGTGDAVVAASIRKMALTNIIKKTKNAVHFSGHTHEYSKYSYNGIDDYSLKADARHKGVAYIVLCKEGTGFVEIKEVSFNY